MSAQNSDLQVIGPKARISFTKYGIFDVPAKIDTGADSSSVWASNIKEKNGVLEFVLFDPTAPWYSGDVIKTKQYSIRSIKNSFGTSEFRYKVPLSVELDGRKIRARFTLSNRANNRYPVLVGRQTLKSRFIVDVAHKPEGELEDFVRVLVLAHRGGEKISNEFTKLASKNRKKLEIDILRYQDLQITIDSSQVVIQNIKNGQDLACYDLIYFLTRVRNAEKAAIVANFAKRLGIAYADQAAANLPSDTKAHQAALLSGHSIGLPKMIVMGSEYWAGKYDYLVAELGSPFIFKDDNGLKGRNNYLVKNKQEFDKACSDSAKLELQMVAQQYIPNDGYYRLVVLGRRVSVAMHRKINTNVSHLFNKDRDGAAQLLEIADVPIEMQQMAIEAAQILQLEVAGVDILQDRESGMWYCLEVNNSPQLVGGAYVSEKMQELAEFFIREAKK